MPKGKGLDVEARLKDYISKNLKTLENNLTNFATKAESKFGQASKGPQGFKKVISEVGSSIMNVAKAFGPAALAAMAFHKAIQTVNNAIRFLIDTNITFEKTMSRMTAIVRPAAEDFDRLQRKARELGEKTVFTASQVGDAFVEMGKLGKKTNDIISASEGILNLAALSQSDMAASSKVAIGVLNQYSLAANETNRVVDVMAKSFTSTALDMEKYATGMQYAGAVSGATNTSVETTSAMLGILADRNIEASMAGTGLRRIMLELADSSSKASVMVAKYDKSAVSLIDKLKALKPISNDIATLTELFTIRGVVQAQTLIDNANAVEKLTRSFEKSKGTAQKMADIMLDNVYGATIRLKSAQEELSLTLGETLQPAMRAWKESLIGITRWLTAVIRETYGAKFAMQQLDIEKSMSKQFDIEFQLMEIEKEITLRRSGQISQVANTKRNMEGVVETQANLNELLERQADLQIQLRLAKGFAESPEIGLQEAMKRQRIEREKEKQLKAMIAAERELTKGELKSINDREKRKQALISFFNKWAMEEYAAVVNARQKLEKQALAEAVAIERERVAIVAESLARLQEMQIHHKFALSEIALSDWSSEKEFIDNRMNYEAAMIELEYQRKIEAARKIGAETKYIEEAKQLELDILTKKHEEVRSKIIRDNAKAGLDMMVDNLRTAASEYKVFGNLYKTAAITQTTIDTYKAAQAAYSAMAGIPYVGPALGVIAAAAAVAAGLANISKIRKESFGWGTESAPGGQALVGERGIELVAGPKAGYLPRGSTVINNTETKKMFGGTTININIPIPESSYIDRDAAEFIVDRIERIKRDLEYGQANGLLNLQMIGNMG